MVLYFIGLGLGDEKDITVKGLEAIKSSDRIYLESYTSRLVRCSKEELEDFYGKKVILADRDLVENKAEETILKGAKKKNIAFLIIGDPFSATTHLDLKLRADQLGIKTEIISNASITNAIGITGLDLYKFGRTTTIPFDNKGISSPYDVVKNNLKNSLHTLVLFDLDPAEDRYMQVSQALNYLLDRGLSKSQLCVGCAGLGGKNPEIKAGKAKGLLKKRFAKYPQCLVVVSKLHFMEEEALKKYI
ncbi:diphthine synthase [Candidatus Woesearchaeota archaeon]|nr:diphthine synthase [Candidatus Woesearchaeota archaeon]